MIRFIYGRDLVSAPLLSDTMFRDRAGQFRSRLDWAVSVDSAGRERDQYDGDRALYCIYELPDGTHGGSGRLMPTTEPTMLNDHFSHLAGGEIVSPLVWESTRFCVSPRLTGGAAAASRISTALMLAGCEVALRFGLSHFAAVFDAPMRRIYRATGWPPEILAEQGKGRRKLCLGLWEVSPAARQAILDKAPKGLALGPIPSPLPGAGVAPMATGRPAQAA
ncbi:acyl-homoserine-lactone synthase [Albimonas sp. CAU 1670]|uniref:acyl-homoserine-lactone synthase n=1 Tax=Albimonas sp. CAU 1670 TaxID=3032599 RepID=UPI0023DC0705|nr:acyl-homoserine-lactone synthase [Albimonas sp. CAU 1670]MDF2231151.1 acyl-homoserine-lactone synthase [Albimonas sp. CAU 1670]